MAGPDLKEHTTPTSIKILQSTHGPPAKASTCPGPLSLSGWSGGVMEESHVAWWRKIELFGANYLKIIHSDFLDFFLSVTHSWRVPIIKISHLYMLCKWENLQNHICPSQWDGSLHWSSSSPFIFLPITVIFRFFLTWIVQILKPSRESTASLGSK